MYEQKMGPKVPAVDATKTEAQTTSTPQNDDESNKIKKEQPKKDRVYRKRKSSAQDASDDEAEETAGVDPQNLAKKAHLQSNLDADSDFSIDSDSDDEAKEDTEPATTQHNPTDVPTRSESQPTIVTADTKVNSENVTNDEKVKSSQDAEVAESKVEEVVVEVPKDEPKIDRKKIWEKRTVDDVLVGAIQRYFERKLLREG